jgi:hypothetical protein
MGQKSLPIPIVATIITVIVLVLGIFIYKGVAHGGTVGDGKEGNVQASPPMPESAKQQMIQDAQNKPH